MAKVLFSNVFFEKDQHLNAVESLIYPSQEICVGSYLERFIEKTKDLWKDQNFYISFVKLHNSITTSTISR